MIPSAEERTHGGEEILISKQVVGLKAENVKKYFSGWGGFEKGKKNITLMFKHLNNIIWKPEPSLLENALHFVNQCSQVRTPVTH